MYTRMVFVNLNPGPGIVFVGNVDLCPVQYNTNSVDMRDYRPCVHLLSKVANHYIS